MTAGSWTCAPQRNGNTPGLDVPIAAPWSTSFEDGFCDYVHAGGFCYKDAQGSFEIVTSPVRTGAAAAAFTVTTHDDATGAQARCVRTGVLPAAAYYGAYYYIPEAASNEGNWNLFHFQGGDPANPHDLWDISLASPTNAPPRVYVYDFLHGRRRDVPAAPPIPIGTWFHLEFYRERAADATGKIMLYQDHQLVLELGDLSTDDTTWGQWYVGNLANALMPAQSTVYVDDITIRTDP